MAKQLNSTASMCPTVGDGIQPASNDAAGSHLPGPVPLEATRSTPGDMCPTLADIAAARRQVQAGEAHILGKAQKGELKGEGGSGE